MSKPCELTAWTDFMALGCWRDIASVQRYMGLLTKDRLKQAVEAAWQ